MEQGPAKLRRRMAVIAMVAALLSSFVISVYAIRAYDLWWHLRFGEWILQHGSVPNVDVFSYTVGGKIWVNHSWLSDIILWCLFRLGGVNLLIFLKCVFIAGSLALALYAAQLRKSDLITCALVAVNVGFLMLTRSLVRPFIFSFVLFTGAFVIIQTAFINADDDSSQAPAAREYLWGPSGKLILLLPVMLMWVNLHAGFVSGALLYGAYGAGELIRLVFLFGRRLPRAVASSPSAARFRAMLLVGFLIPVVMLVNPFGLRALTYPVKLLTKVEFLRTVLEWTPTPFSARYVSFWVLLFFCALGPVIELVPALRARWDPLSRQPLRRGLAWGDLIAVAGFGYMGWNAVRNVVWVLFLAPAVICSRVKPFAPKEGRASGSATKRAVLGCLLVLIIAARFISWRVWTSKEPWLGVSQAAFPAKALDFIRDRRITGRVFNQYKWGGAYIMRFFPERKVFIDGRCLLYGDSIYGRYRGVLRGDEGWREVLAEWKVDFLLLSSHKRSRGLMHLFESNMWWVVYWDDVAVVAVRNSPRNMDTMTRFNWNLSNPIMFDYRLVSGAELNGIVVELNEKIEKSPECAVAYAMLGECSRARGEPEKAMDYCNRALELNRREAWAFRCKGYLYLEAGEIKRAKEMFAGSLELLSGDWLATIGMAYAQIKDSRPEQAVALLDTLMQRDALRKEVHLSAAEAYSRAGRADKTLETLKSVLKKFGDDKSVTEKIQGLKSDVTK